MLLREPVAEDVDALFEIQRDPVAMQHTYIASDREAPVQHLRDYESRFSEDGFMPWTAVFRENRQIVVVGAFPQGMHPQAPPDPGDGAYVHGFGVSHFGLRVLDVDAAVAELRAREVKILAEPFEEDSGLKYAYIAAPDGVVIELTQYETPAKEASPPALTSTLHPCPWFIP